MGNSCNHLKFIRSSKNKKIVKKNKIYYCQFNIGDNLEGYLITHIIYNKIYILTKGINKYVGKCIKKKYRGEYELEIIKKNNSNLLPIFEYYIELELYDFIIYKHIDGKDIYDTFIDNIPIREKEVRPLFWQMLKCINHCQELGYLHLDIKPENFIATPIKHELNGKTKYRLTLIDFGYCIPNVLDKIMMSDYRGTNGYMAPEIFMKFVTSKTDLWSLGCVIYVMLTGKFPFHKSKVQFLQDIYSSEHYNGLLKNIQHVSEDLQELIIKMLKPDQDERISIEELMTHRYFNKTVI